MKRPQIIVGDITDQAVDAIVNAANNTLLGGGGVDGAIHRAAGRGLYEECLKLNGCKTGEAKITGGHNLLAKHVIHTVGPIYGKERGLEAELLADCYRNTLNLAKKHHLTSIAFPAISTGIYGYPKAEAAAIAVKTVLDFLEREPSDLDVSFVFSSSENASYYEALLSL